MYELLLLFGIFITGINCGYYFVTAPNIIRFDNDETVVVSVFGLNNAAVKVWLQLGDNRISEQNVIVKDEKTPQYSTVKVTENDLFNTVGGKPRTIRIFSEWYGQTQSREIILSYKTGYFFVQTDKPIYTPLQNVKIRTLALDESLRKVNGRQVVIDILDPSSRKLGRKKMGNSTSGFFDHQFKLPPYPDIGIWTVRAFYEGQLETEARSLFEVKEYVLPTYGVEIYVDVPYILRDTASIQVTVRAKYVYGKPVDGNARLTFNLKDKNEVSEYILDVNKRTLEFNDNNEGSLIEFSIKVADILNSPLLKDKDFPDGSRLEVVATVFESATGKEEATSHEGTLFATKPYIFKFTKSKLNFRPGMLYFLKVEVLKANGQSAAWVNVKVKMYKNGVLDQSEASTTDENGLAVSMFQTLGDANVIEFTAETTNKPQESEKFKVKAFDGTNQIQVGHIIKNDKMVMFAFTNIKPGGYTGMLFMVVTRGKIVYTSFKEAANQASEQIMEELQEVVSPDARLIVFYVDEVTHQLVTDSIKFEVEKKCRGEGLNLATDNPMAKPGSRVKLTVTGSPYMWVGLNVMDKALLFLNNKNVFRKNKMYEVLQSHDLGCGVGGGKTSADVFKKSGLTVLTNANVDANDLVRNTDGCGKKRKKRANGPFSEISGCEQGNEFPDDLIYNTDDTDDTKDLDKCVDCYTQAKNLTREKRSENTRIKKRSLNDESDYEMDMTRVVDAGIRPIRRAYFIESWLFQLVQLDSNGQANVFLDFPDSITEWMIQGIGITPDNGMCIAEDIDVNAYRNFIIQLDLPYKAFRLEHFDVKATIFNYGTHVDDNILANVYLDGVGDLCYYNSVRGEPSPKVRIELPPNSAKTVSFPMISLRKGSFKLKVTAIAVKTGIPEMDVIEKPLYVVNEGIEQKITIHVCLNPENQDDNCKNDERVIMDVKHGVERMYKVDLTLPRDSISQTGSATPYIQGNLVTVKTVIEGVDSLFQLPYGNGESTISRLAQTVYAMAYMKQTKQVTKDIEKKGNQWIRDGIVRQVSRFQHSDGSYSSWIWRASSTWLSAFVSKVFCQANKTIDDVIDESSIEMSIDWLKNNIKNDGSFVDNKPVWNRSMMGQINERDPSLTAFVLIALQECDITSNGLKDTIVRATKFLETLPEATLKSNSYRLAICTYALALVNSPYKYRFKALLHQAQKRNGEEIYWGNVGGKPASAQSVETTAYALLAMIEFNDFRNCSAIVRWLISQRSFNSLQETVVGLQALTKYSQATYFAEVDLSVMILADNWNWEQYYITNENAHVHAVVRQLPVEQEDNLLTVKVSGTGSGIMTIDLRYNRPASEEESCPFEISEVEVEEIYDVPLDENLAKERNCDVCGRCNPEQPDDYDIDMFDAHVEANSKIESYFGWKKRQANRGISATKTITCIRFSVSSKTDKEYGMSVVNFGLETGVEIVQSDLEKLTRENPNIARYEVPSNGHGFVIFYLNKITSQEINFIFRLQDEFEGDIYLRQPSSVMVYEYYNSAQKCAKVYGTGPNSGQSIDFECDREKKYCKCLQGMCVKPVEHEISRMTKRNLKPALALYRYTCSCNSVKANYAVLVKIESLDYRHETNHKTARAIVLKSIRKGIERLEMGDSMTFFWNMNCEQPDLEGGKQYIIIGKDGNKVLTNGEEEYHYPLMGTALVLSDYKRGQNALQFNVLKRYQQLIAARGC